MWNPDHGSTSQEEIMALSRYSTPVIAQDIAQDIAQEELNNCRTRLQEEEEHRTLKLISAHISSSLVSLFKLSVYCKIHPFQLTFKRSPATALVENLTNAQQYVKLLL